MAKIVIGTVAYNSLTADLVRSVVEHPLVHLIVHVHSEEQAIQPGLAAAESAPGVSIYNHKFNRGLSKSWNDIIKEAYDDMGADSLIICNDDIVFTPGDIEKIVDKAMRSPKHYMVSCAGYHEVHQARVGSHGYSCFALNPIAIDEIGYFDQNFWPAYYEDNDHHRRATLLGLVEENCPDTNVIHKGSNSIRYNKKLEQQNVRTFVNNRNYYERKWGGIPGKEVYRRPFNDSSLSNKISYADRNKPYGPDRDRASLGISSRLQDFI